MTIYYLSLTGNIHKFLQKLGTGYCCQNILEKEFIVQENSIFVVPTIGFGQPPAQTVQFLEQYHEKIIYLVGSGNKNWGAAYCGGAQKLSKQFGIPILLCFELQGTNETVEIFKEKINALPRA